MAESFKEKVEEAGHKVAETTSKVSHKVGETVEEATNWAKEKAHQAGDRIEEVAEKAEHKAKEVFGKTGNTANIREHMDVYASCGTKIGKVDHVEGDSIKLTKNDSPDGMHHRIPASWVAKVDDHVHLSKDHKDVQSQWKPA